jgi:hypothetical protein
MPQFDSITEKKNLPGLMQDIFIKFLERIAG